MKQTVHPTDRHGPASDRRHSRKAGVRILLVILGVFVAATLTSCGGGQPTTKYQPSDKNAPTQPILWNFDTDPTGGLPTGATVFTGSWAIRSEADTPSRPNALCQTGSADFPAMSLGNAIYTDVELTSRFKPISGQSDRAAGLIFRIQDKDNYYIVRANALENSVVIFMYAGGQRSTIKEGSVPVATGQWQVLRAEAAGNHIRGFLNDQLVVEATDDTYKAGEVGLWTKSDSATCFDDVEVKQL